MEHNILYCRRILIDKDGHTKTDYENNESDVFMFINGVEIPNKVNGFMSISEYNASGQFALLYEYKYAKKNKFIIIEIKRHSTIIRYFKNKLRYNLFQIDDGWVEHFTGIKSFIQKINKKYEIVKNLKKENKVAEEIVMDLAYGRLENE